MPQINFPTAAMNPAAFGVLSLASVYIGAINVDPTVLGNRIDVVVTQQNGTPVTIHAAGQPFQLGAGGLLMYGGYPILASTAVPYSMSIVPVSGTTVYLPNSGSGTDVNTSVVVMTERGSNPTPIAGAGQFYTKAVAGIAEVFYEDSTGQVIQFSNNGSLNIDLSTGTVQALIISATEQVEGTQFRGVPVTLTIDGSNNVACDMTLGLNYSLNMTGNVTNFTLSNIPTAKVPNICVEIINTGAFTITNFVTADATYHIYIPNSVANLQPTANARTSYGLAVMPGKILHIFPVLMKNYS